MGLSKLDLDLFWKNDAVSHEKNCFNPEATQVALGIRMSDECVFAELKEKGNPWEYMPASRRNELNKRYNEKAIEIVGIKLLREDYDYDNIVFPYIKRIGEVFGGTYSLSEQGGEWLHSDINTPKQLEERLDFIDRLDLHDFLFPKNWEIIKKQIFEQTGKKIPRVRHVRGPVTLATSIFGVENLVFLYYDAPELFERFSKTIGDVIIKISKIIDEEYDEPEYGFSFADDDCALFTSEMYEKFGLPVLKRVFSEFAPHEEDMRYQHSDSAMNHLLPLLAEVNLTECNFGPTVLVEEIRKYMPNTRIDGCIAPFTFMGTDKNKLIKEVIRDCEAIKRTGTKGLNIFTAGSINNGSSLENMRLVIETILEYGIY